MFVELNDLRCVIVRVPESGLTVDLRACARLAPRVRCVYLVDGPPPPGIPTGAGNHVVLWADGYLYPVRANIKRALDEAGAQPYEAVYVTCDPREIPEAARTRVGTVLVGSEPVDEALTDVMADDISKAADILANVTPDSVPGYFGEVLTTIGESGRPVGNSGTLVMPSRPLREHIRSTTRTVVLGRYFPEGDARHGCHQPTRRLLDLKNRSPGPREPFVEVLAVALRWVDDGCPFDAITRVPQKPDDRRHGRPDSLADLVQAACRLGRVNAARPLGPRFQPDLLQCVRDYPPQKAAGSLESRRRSRGVPLRQRVEGTACALGGRHHHHREHRRRMRGGAAGGRRTFRHYAVPGHESTSGHVPGRQYRQVSRGGV
ncbi:MAG: hypothetical protein K6V97_09065 [Actinomycetia bacterium]|nr:hypothetical protein [Actinomycetes bacterium]